MVASCFLSGTRALPLCSEHETSQEETTLLFQYPITYKYGNYIHFISTGWGGGGGGYGRGSWYIQTVTKIQCSCPRLLPYQESEDNILTFSPPVSLPAIQATPLPSLDMMVVLDPTGQLVLYSGSMRVGQLVVH